MKNLIIAILIAFSTGIIMSCNPGSKGAENQTTTTESTKKMEEPPVTEPAKAENHEAEETHELNTWGAGEHKGIVAEAGEKNHIEMALSGKDVNFYPLDDLTNSVDTKGWTGKAILQYKGGSSKTFDLMIMNGALTAMGANTDKSFTAIATLMNNGQSISAQFSSEGSSGK